MTEEIAATPGWVDDGLDALFATLPDVPGLKAARAAYAVCLATRKQPAVPSDMLGAEFEPCRPALHRALLDAGIEQAAWTSMEPTLEALEAEIADDS